MSEQSPYQKLGVAESASFEEIQDAKQRLLEENRNDAKVIEGIETAYDAIIMDRLRMRQEGKIKVPDRIRFPEKSPETPNKPIPVSSKTGPAWLQRLIDTPSVAEIIWPGAIFLLLGLGSLLMPSQPTSPLPLLMALGFAVNIYFLNRKEQRFGRAFLLTLGGLLIGLALGYGMASFLLNQQVLASFSPEQLASLVTFSVFWLISSFLR